MANLRPYTFALMSLLAVAAVTPVRAQNNKPPKPSKAERAAMTKTERKERKAERKAEKHENMMDTTSGTVAPSRLNNTADAQRNVESANKTLSDMVATLDQIDARKKAGSAQ